MKRIDYAHLAAYTATLCFGVFTLYLFAGLWTNGGLFMYEDNLIIRGIETAMAVGFVLFGVWGVVYLLRRMHKEQMGRIKVMGKRGKQEQARNIAVALSLIAVAFLIGATGSWMAFLVAFPIACVLTYLLRHRIRGQIGRHIGEKFD